MKEMSRRYGALARTYAFRKDATADVMVSTKTLAAPMRSAVATRPLTPMKGQRPRKRTSVKLFTSMALMKIQNSSPRPLFMPPSPGHPPRPRHPPGPDSASEP